jgi:magnesium chelatase family protein
MVAEVPAMAPAELLADEATESSAVVRARVAAARERARRRGHGTNARLTGRALREQQHPGVRRLLEDAALKLNLSARALDRVTRVARTIADLTGDAVVAPQAVAEALRYRHIPQGHEEPSPAAMVTPPG